MNHNKVLELIPDYLNNDLDADTITHLLGHIEDCANCKNELSEYKILFDSINAEKPLKPSTNLRSSFLKKLEVEKNLQSKFTDAKPSRIIRFNLQNKFIRIAAVLLIMFGCYWYGRFHQANKPDKVVTVNNKNNDKEAMAMFDLMESKSASKRIEAILNTDNINEVDDNIINALISRMRNDENVNVRLYAVEALSRYLDLEKVKQSFIEALETEKNPNIQITIIQSLVKIQEKRAIDPMRRLLKDESTEPFVKEQLEELIPILV